jgi:type IV secretory pathway VirB2 component (pilin)
MKLDKALINLKKMFDKAMSKIAYLAIYAISSLPGLAFAAGDSGDTVTTVIYNICDWLSGAPAVGIGILAVIYTGYEMLHGEIHKKAMIVRCVAIGLIIGGSYIAKSIIMKGIS